MKKELRLNIRADADKIAELREITNSTTNQELLTNALTLLEWAIKEKQEHHSIGSLDEKSKTYRELVMPALSGIG